MQKFIIQTRHQKFSYLSSATNPRSRGLPEKMTGPQLVRKFPAFCATRKFIRTFRLHWMISPTQRLLWLFRNMIKFLLWLFSTSPNPQAGGLPLFGCPRLLIQSIRSYPPCLQAVPPSATRERTMPWWQGPTYHCDRDPLIRDLWSNWFLKPVIL
jgi:hypothetical protein